MTTIKLPLATHLKNVSQLVYGCMGLGGGWQSPNFDQNDIKQAHNVIDACLAQNINLFDHADIYTYGKAESVFGKVLAQRPELREQIYIQSKCGIKLENEHQCKQYDLSAGWVEKSVNDILKRLQCDYLDILLLHRPDPLVELDQLAQQINQLYQAGKIRFIGVSNMYHYQIQYLQSALTMPIIVNQLEMSLAKLGFVGRNIQATDLHAAAPITGNDEAAYQLGTLEHCQMHNIQLQSWGSLAQGKYTKSSTDNDKDKNTQVLVYRLAKKYGVSPEAVVLAFITRHPANIQPVIGTTNIERINACAQVSNITLDREDWYQLLNTRLGNDIP